jgi:hypothetical protein
MFTFLRAEARRRGLDKQFVKAAFPNCCILENFTDRQEKINICRKVKC